MTWNPKEAEQALDASLLVKPTRSVKKIAGYKFNSDRELVLLKENESKVTVYVDVAPTNMPDVVLEKEYPPSTNNEGRHADIEAVARSLGYSYTAYKVHIKSRAGLTMLLNWAQYA
ncbi:MAG: hypothetical protein K1564_09175 [Candidatus Thiodiazotropha sp. (ex. Lucinisca nassula)]|nr:hypothetical protein [Candidatus Thiodiazotropha sp. (ex. Lucinisca nassula)]